MLSRIETIENSLKKRKRKRNLIVLLGTLLPLCGLVLVMNGPNFQRPYASSLPVVSTANEQSSEPANDLERQMTDTAMAEDSVLGTAAQNDSLDKKAKQVQDIQIQPETIEGEVEINQQASSNPELLTAEKVVVKESASNPTQTASKEEVYYISMPAYESWPLKRKMDLMRNRAYSPQEKAELRRHITKQFVNRARARVSVIDQGSNGKRETRSYPIGMYLDRLQKNPTLQFRLVEKVSDSGQLSGLVVKE